jgi:phospholipid/cholesterol/gamma-HCH transport system ATP-binding protein
MSAADEFQYHASDLDLLGEPDSERWSIRCLDVYKRLGGVPVLNGLNVAFPEDTITVVLGPSGTGKSVLIKNLIGLMFPDAGDIIVKGQSVPSLTMPKLLALRRKIGVLFQDGALFGSMSVFDNVAFPLRQHSDLSEAQISERVKQRLADVGLSAPSTTPPRSCRGNAQARRVRAGAGDGPDVVSSTSPTRAWTQCARRCCAADPEMRALQHLHRRHARHRLGAADRRVHRAAVEGADRGSGDAQRMFSSDNEFVRQFLEWIGGGPLTMD